MDSLEKSAKELLAVVRELRRKCPWDNRQTHKSLAKYLQEEAAEVIEAIYKEDYDYLKKELGDLLFQILIHSEIAEEKGEFSFEDVVNSIKNKMIERHPHVFNGENKEYTEEELKKNWDEKKKKEKGGKKYDSMKEVAEIKEMPFSKKALFIQNYAARKGFDWEKAEDIIDKIYEEIEELRNSLKRNNREEIEEEIGDIILVITNLCRFLQIDFDRASLKSIEKFAKRFDMLQEEIYNKGKRMNEFSLEELEEMWQRVKNDNN